MADQPDFEVAAAHKYFSTHCFNKAWDLIEREYRTVEDEEEMLRLTLASHWHWTQREDYGPTNASIAHWQTSRVQAILGQADEARRYGQLALEASQEEEVPPFCLGYAYEALARAEGVAENHQEMEQYLRQARLVAEEIPDVETRKQLLADLKSIR
jgi:hypothetical protein